MLKKLKKMYPHQSLMMIFILGLMIILGSFTVEHIFKVMPCEMCLWQRYLAIAITVTAFAGTLIRGKKKKIFLGTITLLALASLTVGTWQSLAQRDIVALPSSCEAPAEVTTQAVESEDLLANIKANDTGYVDCSKIEDFFLYNLTGLSLANVNIILMLFVSIFSFYKLFFKPRKRFRRYNNNRKNNYNRNRNNNSNNNRRYRGSGYNRSNNRSNRHPRQQNQGK